MAKKLLGGQLGPFAPLRAPMCTIVTYKANLILVDWYDKIYKVRMTGKQTYSHSSIQKYNLLV